MPIRVVDVLPVGTGELRAVGVGLAIVRFGKGLLNRFCTTSITLPFLRIIPHRLHRSGQLLLELLALDVGGGDTWAIRHGC